VPGHDRTPSPARRPVPGQVRPGVQLILGGMSDSHAFVRNGRLDILAVNALGPALYAPVFAGQGPRDLGPTGLGADGYLLGCGTVQVIFGFTPR
jgi:hypothetical protein